MRLPPFNMVILLLGTSAAFKSIRIVKGIAAHKSVRWMTSITKPIDLCGIDFVQQTVVETLNHSFDHKVVARKNAIAKLEKGTNSKKKKGKNTDSDLSIEPIRSDEETKELVEAAVAQAKPFGISDAMVTTASRSEFGDYQINAALALSKGVGMSPR
jgi:Arginyl tRNA synthetase N terminal domain